MWPLLLLYLNRQRQRRLSAGAVEFGGVAGGSAGTSVGAGIAGGGSELLLAVFPVLVQVRVYRVRDSSGLGFRV